MEPPPVLPVPALLELELELAPPLVVSVEVGVGLVWPVLATAPELELEPDGSPSPSSAQPDARDKKSAAAQDCQLGRVSMLQLLCELRASNPTQNGPAATHHP
ncbi:MAG: hypothetical protein ACRBN8_19300 [Nannocystales bacterium]